MNNLPFSNQKPIEMAPSNPSHARRIMILGRVQSMAEYDREAEITPQDLEAINQDWADTVGETYANLLQADAQAE